MSFKNNYQLERALENYIYSTSFGRSYSTIQFALFPAISSLLLNSVTYLQLALTHMLIFSVFTY